MIDIITINGIEFGVIELYNNYGTGWRHTLIANLSDLNDWRWIKERISMDQEA